MAEDLNINIGANPAGVEAGSRRAKVALKGVADGGRDLDAALRRLRTAIDPTYAAMERFNKVKADNLALLRSGIISRKEYNAGMKAAKAALEAETAALEKNTAAGRAKIEAERQARTQALADARAAKAEEARLAQEAARAQRQAQREAAAEARRLRQEQRQAERAAAAEAKRVAQEVAAAERQAKREAREAAKAVEAEERAAQRALRAEEQAARQQAVQQEQAARRAQREAAKAAADAAIQAARQKRQAEREAAAAAREAAAATEAQARAEKQAAAAAQELRASIDPAYAAQMRYNETMRRATQLLMQNKLQQGEWNAIQKQARAQMDLNVRSLGQQNAMYVQLGYQAQDVTASLASGINPLVILAQQGGQTAAALATMGGRVGQVAAFFAGPWGAAIIGATLLLGYLWDAMKEGESATKDLMNAEDRRRMTVKELTQALKEYVNQQREANQTTLQGAVNQAYQTAQAREEITLKMADAQSKLTEAQERYNTALARAQAIPNAGNIGQMLAARAMLWNAQRGVDELKEAYEAAQQAAMESRARYTQTFVEMSELERREQNEKQAAYGAFQREYMAAGTDRAKMLEAERQYNQRLTEIQERYVELKKEETKAKREANRESEKSLVFKSREHAIGIAGNELLKAGFNVGENKQFGGVKHNHPGMGNTAHGLYAIDINMGKGVVEAADPVAKARMDAMVKAYQARGFKVLWNGKVYKPFGEGASYDIPMNQHQHRDHAHMEAPQSIVGKSAGSRLGNQMVQEMERQAQEALRAQEEAVQARVAHLEFEKELNAEDLAMVLELQDQKIEAIKNFYGESSQEAANAMRERVRIERAQARESVEITRSELDQKTDMMMAAAEVERNVAGMRLDSQRELIDFAENFGMTDPKQAVAQRAALLDQEYQLQVAHEQRMVNLRLQNLRDTLKLEDLPLRVRRELNEEIERVQAEHLNRMAEMDVDYARRVQGIQLESAGVTMRMWQDVGSTLSSSMMSAFQGIWTHSTTLQDALINMADQMVYKFVNMGLEMFQQWFMRQVGMTSVQQTQDALRTGSTVSSNLAQTSSVAAAEAKQSGIKMAGLAKEKLILATTTGAHVAAQSIKTGAALKGAALQKTAAATAGLSEVGTSAAVAAAGAYKSTVVIPFIGPVAAPAAAALALAAVLGFGALISARGGQGEVPMDGQLSMLHKKEMVLPEKFAVPLRQMLVGPRSSSGMMMGASSAGMSAREASMSSNNANFYYQPNHNNMDVSMSDLLRRDARELRRWIKNEVRNGGLKFQ